MGSCAAAIIVKTLAPGMKVVVLSETDKIAAAASTSTTANPSQEDEKGAEREMEGHAPEQNDPEEVSKVWEVAGAGEGVQKTLLDEEQSVDVQNVYFEWVPAKYIDVYVSEDGVLEREQIRAKSVKKAELEEKLFGDLYNDATGSQ